MTIYKFTCPPGGSFSIAMQEGAEILCVQLQSGVPRIWARVTPDSQMTQRHFQWAATGGVAPDGKYIGTIQVQNGSLVWHLFEVSR